MSVKMPNSLREKINSQNTAFWVGYKLNEL